MTYSELIFKLSSSEEFHKDLLINALSETGFDTFQDTEQGFNAYIPSADLDQEKLDGLHEAFAELFTFSYVINSIPHQNWNEVWESNFEPLQVSNRCYIRATFHKPHPEYEFEIVIDPKMAFGTGHHQTTALMMEFMLEEDFYGRKVLDMGCGTGILAILASKMGAKEILAIDYDEICYASTLENSELNSVSNIHVLCGSSEVIPAETCMSLPLTQQNEHKLMQASLPSKNNLYSNEKFDIILANINRNILLEQLERYAEVSKTGGLLFLSGFYEEPDLQIINERCETLGFKYVQHKELNDWVAVKFISV